MPPEDITAEQMVSRLLYRDGLMLVIDKPAGIAVHRGPKGGESLEDHFGALRFGLPRSPALAHRLDRDTSGCLVLGRHRKALAQLGKLFKSGAIGKIYWAVVEGGPGGDEGQIELPLGRRNVARGWWMKHDPAGQPAVTKWKVLGRSCSPPPCGEGLGVGVDRSNVGGDALLHLATPLPTLPHKGGGKFTWLALEPMTGRTHQLRVHCAAMGWPIFGDAIYGTASRKDGRKDGPQDRPILHLHAREVVLPLYKNRAPIRVVAPVPAHTRAALTQCGWRDESLPRHFPPTFAREESQGVGS
ncbi:MAG TPA: RNA pseudouridine synthase [Xanthobacteraceae bacterium]|nr:RNA pseudouridine synthase [Xanthobacteraceae bacterium]